MAAAVAGREGALHVRQLVRAARAQELAASFPFAAHVSG